MRSLRSPLTLPSVQNLLSETHRQLLRKCLVSSAMYLAMLCVIALFFHAHGACFRAIVAAILHKENARFNLPPVLFPATALSLLQDGQTPLIVLLLAPALKLILFTLILELKRLILC